MNKGLEILLARIDSHPEEFSNALAFVSRGGRWHHIVSAARDGHFLTPEEKLLLHTKLSSVQGAWFANEVMHELLVAESEAQKQ
jgi:hypothetical protein